MLLDSQQTIPINPLKQKQTNKKALYNIISYSLLKSTYKKTVQCSAWNRHICILILKCSFDTLNRYETSETLILWMKGCLNQIRYRQWSQCSLIENQISWLSSVQVHTCRHWVLFQTSKDSEMSKPGSHDLQKICHLLEWQQNAKSIMLAHIGWWAEQLPKHNWQYLPENKIYRIIYDLQNITPISHIFSSCFLLPYLFLHVLMRKSGGKLGHMLQFKIRWPSFSE